jgi:hypothetical protein
MVETYRAQRYMLVSFNYGLPEIGFPHYIRNKLKHKILGLDEIRPGYMYIESNILSKLNLFHICHEYPRCHSDENHRYQ